MKDNKIWNALTNRYHYIGHVRLYGGQIQYLIRSEKYGWIGALAYSSGAWRLASRDKWRILEKKGIMKKIQKERERSQEKNSTDGHSYSFHLYSRAA